MSMGVLVIMLLNMVVNRCDEYTNRMRSFCEDGASDLEFGLDGNFRKI
jgi:hypothetical protein